jgi:hypothetical protein
VVSKSVLGEDIGIEEESKEGSSTMLGLTELDVLSFLLGSAALANKYTAESELSIVQTRVRHRR